MIVDFGAIIRNMIFVVFTILGDTGETVSRALARLEASKLGDRFGVERYLRYLTSQSVSCAPCILVLNALSEPQHVISIGTKLSVLCFWDKHTIILSRAGAISCHSVLSRTTRIYVHAN